ncbi:ClpP/crotonase-like domain-containing protein [Halteromyces radiatus]|uniref:ClpP/crotonase-like domain-containing protein n=1 Tax=Halteromyces radiatus TaxID=101107 RepID=UPI00221FB603|nr:ClpP/crotonase-like domain-containing protein [Halteromyces radiatus]KAI8086224.1 ClpP/crotonase-like domain-containing protein [Halteromyces radiatus]
MLKYLQPSFTLLGRSSMNKSSIFRTVTTLTQPSQQPVEEQVLIQETGKTRSFTLNRPRVLNAMTIEMVETFFPCLQAWEKSEDVNMIFLKGNGRALCAGGDVKAALGFIHQKDGQFIDILDMEYRMFHYVATMKKPYIALMDGITMGAGGGLSVNAPFRIATENTQFAMPENTIGLFPDVGASFFLSRLDGQVGTYMGMTGHVIKAHDVLYSGIATHFVPSIHLPELEARLTELDTSDHDIINDTINAFASEQLDHPQMKNQHFTLCGDTRRIIDRCFRYDTAEEIVDALEKDGSAFAKAARETILKRGPTSIKITLEHLRRGIHMGITDCMKMEYSLWQKMAIRHDFTEGVTSQLITRQPPQWQPSTLEQVDHKELKKVFFDTPAERSIKMIYDNDNYLVHPYRRYVLPSESDIIHVLKQHPTWQQKDLLDHFGKLQQNKFGVAEKVKDVWNRLM